MSDTSQGEGWWEASDGKWYSAEAHPKFIEDRPPPPSGLSVGEGTAYGPDSSERSPSTVEPRQTRKAALVVCLVALVGVAGLATWGLVERSSALGDLKDAESLIVEKNALITEKNALITEKNDDIEFKDSLIDGFSDLINEAAIENDALKDLSSDQTTIYNILIECSNSHMAVIEAWSEMASDGGPGSSNFDFLLAEISRAQDDSSELCGEHGDAQKEHNRKYPGSFPNA